MVPVITLIAAGLDIGFIAVNKMYMRLVQYVFYFPCYDIIYSSSFGQLCQKIWTEVVLRPFFSRIVESLTTTMNICHQNDAFINTTLIQCVQELSCTDIECSQFSSTNINTTDMTDIQYWIKILEKKFLRTIEDFYRNKPIPSSFESNDELFGYIKSVSILSLIQHKYIFG